MKKVYVGMSVKNPLLSYRPVQTSLDIENARKKDAQIFYINYQNKLILRPCPVCFSENFKDLDKYANSFSVRKCLQCGLIYVPEIPDQTALIEYYKNSESARILNQFYKSRNNQKSSISAHRLELALQAIKLSGKQDVSILEIGCGDGAFLENLRLKLKNLGIQAHLYGIEANSELAAKAAARYPIEIKSCYFNSEHIFNRSEIDLVCCFEVIEHITEPRYVFAKIYKVLSPSGSFIITTPNIEGLENIAASYNDQRLLAHAICPPAHLQGFSRVTLAILATLTGFGIYALDAKGKFDVYAADYYAKNQKIDAEIKDIFDFFERSFVEDDSKNLDILQKLINHLNASSTISAIFTRNSK